MNQNKEKINLIIIGIITILLGLIPFLYLAIKQGINNLGSILGIIVIVILVIFMAILSFKHIKTLKKEQPHEDELSKKVLNLAAARTLFISLYWILILMLFEPVIADILFNSKNFNTKQSLGSVVIGVCIIFLINFIYFQKRSDRV